MGDRLQRQHLATAFQPTTNNTRHVFNPPQNGQAEKGVPPSKGRPARKVIAVDGSRGGSGTFRVPPAFGQCQSGAGEPRWRGKLWVSPGSPAFCLVCLVAESSSHELVALWVGRLHRAETRDTPAQTLGLLSLACAPWRGRGHQGRVPSCPSLFVLRGPGSPFPTLRPPHAWGAVCGGVCPLPAAGFAC